MSKEYTALGLMSGTSMDGVDASIIQSDGETKYKVILDKYFEYPKVIYKHLTKLRDKIKSPKDLKKFSNEVKNIEKEITVFHAKTVNKILKESKANIDLIGFHGQTIYHNAHFLLSKKKRISRQLGDGRLLSKLTKKTVVFNFRQNDLKNDGAGAPLTPIFHLLIKNKYKLKLPLIILNIGGITNITGMDSGNNMYSCDAGPGNCLIDQWIRKNSRMKYDKDGKIAMSGKINKEILKKALEKLSVNTKGKYLNRSLDIKDFDISFVKKLSLEDGAATLTEFTSKIIADEELFSILDLNNVIISGGGRKNKFLVKRIEEKFSNKLKLIDDLGIDGDFVESQAFAYLAIRSYLKLPISFPETTGCSRPCTGGTLIKAK
tara:strand:+ start:363 stop:1490 length:1128 start_codon:yes stop_codon:yes gene_type:complete